MAEKDDLDWIEDLINDLEEGRQTEANLEEIARNKRKLREAMVSNEEDEGDAWVAQLELVESLVAEGASQEDATDWVVEFSNYIVNEDENKQNDDEELLALLDGPFKVLRDDTFADTERILIWDRQATPSVQALTFDGATERYKCGGEGSRWVPDDLEEIKEVKRACIKQTLESYRKHDNDPDYDGMCGTPALIISNNPLRAHRWVEVKAYLDT